MQRFSPQSSTSGEYDDVDEGYISARSLRYALSVASSRTRRQGQRRSGFFFGEAEDDGYFSADDEDEMQMIRVKLHYQNDVRGMALPPSTLFEDFVAEIAAKFERLPGQVELRFQDEDGHQVSLRDRGDYALAVETARSGSRGRPDGKLVIFCLDLATQT